MIVRCKFECVSVNKQKNWNTGAADKPFLYAYRMQVVTSGSDENKQFFASTPSGSIEVGAVREDVFEPGKKYYVDFTPAE
jgi:hypothetical protein